MNIREQYSNSIGGFQDIPVGLTIVWLGNISTIQDKGAWQGIIIRIKSVLVVKLTMLHLI